MKIFLILIGLIGFHSVEAMSKAPSFQKEHDSAIGVRTVKYEDQKRGRPVLVEIWYPAGPVEALPELAQPAMKEFRGAPLSSTKEKYPLILFSHGNRGDRRDRSWLAEQLVKAGFLVVSVEHYGNTWSSYNPLASLKFWERARDVSFALDQVLVDPILQERIDEERIGFAGYSLGGMTGLALAGAVAQNAKEAILRHQDTFQGLPLEILDRFDFTEAHQSYKDSRIKAFALICPALFFYSSETLKQIKAPVGLIAAIQDEVLPHKQHAYQIIKNLAHLKLKVMRKGISHYAFVNCVSEKGKKFAYDEDYKDLPGCDRAALHKETGLFITGFFREALHIP